MHRLNLTRIMKSGVIALIASFSLAYAADQKIDVKAELTGEGDNKTCKITYIDVSSESNCEASDNCTKADECICVRGGAHVQWKAKGGNDKFKFKITNLDSIFEDGADCKVDKLKKTHNCKVKSDAAPGRHKYDFVGTFKGETQEYPCEYDPTIVIKSQQQAPAPSETEND